MSTAVTPFVSICIPCYKNEKTLLRLLESIAAQTFKDFEVVVTDDSPTSELSKLAMSFQDRFKIKYFHNVPALGPAKNWNYALSLGQGSLLKIMHHDDWFSGSQSLEKFVLMMQERPNAAMGFAGTANYDSREILRNIHTPSRGALEVMKKDPTILCRGNVVGAPTAVIVRRDLGIEYDPSLKWLVDVDYYISILLKHKASFVATTETLVNVTVESQEQLTALCEGNMQVELQEFAHVYNKIVSRVGRTVYAFFNMWSLVQRFEITEANFHDAIPAAEPFRSDCWWVVKGNSVLAKAERVFSLTRKIFSPAVWTRFFIKRLVYALCHVNSSHKK